MRPRLESITLRGFKTIRELKDFAPGPLTVLIGPNGAGKSNFFSFFRMLSWALAPPGGLQEYVARQGGASALLHGNSALAPEIETRLALNTAAGKFEYFFRLSYAAGDKLTYSDERTSNGYRLPYPGLPEATLTKWADTGVRAAQSIVSFIAGMAFYHLHSASETSRIRQKWDAQDNLRLKEDAGNLAPFLLRLSLQTPDYYRRIIETIRLVLPFFAEFELEPQYGSVLLRWRERGSDRVFHAGQASDGMLRIMALVALLQQPPDRLPHVLIIDEPELGLHPFAIEVIADLIRATSKAVQVIVATQSVFLIDRFDPSEVVVVDREQRESKFRRLDAGELKSWLEAYSISELWEKNVIGGRPAR